MSHLCRVAEQAEFCHEGRTGCYSFAVERIRSAPRNAAVCPEPGAAPLPSERDKAVAAFWRRAFLPRRVSVLLALRPGGPKDRNPKRKKAVTNTQTSFFASLITSVFMLFNAAARYDGPAPEARAVPASAAPKGLSISQRSKIARPP
jgi:hypothetical protein